MMIFLQPMVETATSDQELFRLATRAAGFSDGSEIIRIRYEAMCEELRAN